MKRPIVTMLGILLAGIALAGAHFMSAEAALQGSSLNVSFREAGLGDNQLIHYIASAHSSAFYACINGGGTNPSASNKRQIDTDLAVPGSFSSGKNGSLYGNMKIELPDPAFNCPSGQKRTLISVSYSNVKVTDTDHDISAPIAGTFAYTFVNLP